MDSQKYLHQIEIKWKLNSHKPVNAFSVFSFADQENAIMIERANYLDGAYDFNFNIKLSIILRELWKQSYNIYYR